MALRTNLRPTDKREISGSERFTLERLMILLPTNLASNLSPLNSVYVSVTLIT